MLERLLSDVDRNTARICDSRVGMVRRHFFLAAAGVVSYVVSEHNRQRQGRLAPGHLRTEVRVWGSCVLIAAEIDHS